MVDDQFSIGVGFLVSLPLAILTFAACNRDGSAERDQPQAEVLAGSPELAATDRLAEALGGAENWAKAPRYLRFDFRIEFNGEEFLFSEHLWDRHEGAYRVTWRLAQEGVERTALFNVTTKEGIVWVEGDPVPEESAQALLDAAYYRFSNDSYWLLAPLKLRDPGANLQYVGEESWEGRTYDRIHVTFNNVGLSPGDEFWWDLNRETGLLDRWAFYLEASGGSPNLEEASVWRWGGWETVNGMQVARERVLIDSPDFPQFSEGRIDFPVLSFFDEVDPTVFTDLNTPLPR